MPSFWQAVAMISSLAMRHNPAQKPLRLNGMRPVRATLRKRTAAIHEALHGAAPFAAIAERRLDLGGYCRLLGALSGFHSSLAIVVEAGCRSLDDPALLTACERRRELLARDLDAIGGQGATRASRPLELIDEAWAAGCLYTLVGSTVGGKVIYRQLDYLLKTPTGRTFFAGTSEDGARWRGLCERLEAFGAEPESLTRLVAGAHAAFQHFASCLEGHS